MFDKILETVTNHIEVLGNKFAAYNQAKNNPKLANTLLCDLDAYIDVCHTEFAEPVWALIDSCNNEYKIKATLLADELLPIITELEKLSDAFELQFKWHGNSVAAKELLPEFINKFNIIISQYSQLIPYANDLLLVRQLVKTKFLSNRTAVLEFLHEARSIAEKNILKKYDDLYFTTFYGLSASDPLDLNEESYTESESDLVFSFSTESTLSTTDIKLLFETIAEEPVMFPDNCDNLLAEYQILLELILLLQKEEYTLGLEFNTKLRQTLNQTVFIEQEFEDPELHGLVGSPPRRHLVV